MKKILVCGTGFGQYYLKAMKNLAKEVKLIGILSRGSKQSRQWANKLSVPLYTSLKELDDVDIDIACVVIKSEIVGGLGTAITKYFLNRGIHVFQEHPMHYTTYAECIKTAKINNCCYFMNTFYPFLKSVHKFLTIMDEVKKIAQINYIRAECGVQVLLPMIDILGRISGQINSLQIDHDFIDEKQIPFAVIKGTIAHIPFILLVKNNMDIQHPECNISLLHQLNVNTSRGNLTLTDVHGQVLWTPGLHENLKDESSHAYFTNIPIQQSFIKNDDLSMEDIFEILWPESISRSLQEFIHIIDNKKNMAYIHQYYLSVCKIWREIGIKLGAYKPVNDHVLGPLKLDIEAE